MYKKSKWIGGKTHDKLKLPSSLISFIIQSISLSILEWRKRWFILKGSKLFFSKVTIYPCLFSLSYSVTVITNSLDP
ncbi:hypothetical protein EON65_00210 [archaeon]|nr:MAG: hypothetical protein EON65_00210 [archaeon]